MSMSIDAALVVVSTVLSIVGVGSFGGAIKVVKDWGKNETNRTRDIDEIKKTVTNIEHTLGNGGFGGIKEQIQKIQISCAGEMADHKARIENLESGRTERQP